MEQSRASTTRASACIAAAIPPSAKARRFSSSRGS
jgi:hypothetical protein